MSSPFRRPKGKGGTKSGLNLGTGIVGIGKSGYPGDATNSYDTERHKYFSEVGLGHLEGLMYGIIVTLLKVCDVFNI